MYNNLVFNTYFCYNNVVVNCSSWECSKLVDIEFNYVWVEFNHIWVTCYDSINLRFNPFLCFKLCVCLIFSAFLFKSFAKQKTKNKTKFDYINETVAFLLSFIHFFFVTELVKYVFRFIKQRVL